MTRDELEHIVRAASAISNEYEIVVVGSQSILGEFPNAPQEFLDSTEADVYPYMAPDKADLIDGSIGEDSIFHEQYGYYAQGVSPTTAVLPAGWEKRLTRIEAKDSVGFCISVHDLALAKLVASREKDLAFVKGLLKHKMVDKDKLKNLANDLPVDSIDKDRVNRVLNTLMRIEKSLSISRDISM